jgi:transcription elongation factor GreA
MSSMPITKEGYDHLRKEYDRLKKIDLPEVIKAVSTARAHGDLKENAEYHAARERQSHLMGQIAFLEDKIARAQVLTTNTKDSETVIFGCTVKTLDLSDDTEEEWVLVGPGEADPSNYKISTISPVGKGLLGKRAGEIAEIETPRRLLKLKILSFH